MYTYRELSEKARNGTLDETLVITNINLDDNRHASAFTNFFSNVVLHHTLGEENAEWLNEQLENVRGYTALEDYLKALEPIASTLVSEYWIAPMFHHTQTLRFQGVLEDVALTNWGWYWIFARCGRQIKVKNPTNVLRSTLVGMVKSLGDGVDHEY